jgi:hypothetical protein
MKTTIRKTSHVSEQPKFRTPMPPSAGEDAEQGRTVLSFLGK